MKAAHRLLRTVNFIRHCSSPMVLPPQVAPVTYLRMSSRPVLYTARGRTLAAFPVGVSLAFTVQFYNSIGEKFHTHNTQLHLALNRCGAKGVVCMLW